MSQAITAIKDIEEAQAASQGTMITKWFKEMTDAAVAYFETYPNIRLLALAAGAETLEMPRKGHIKLKQTQTSLPEVVEAWAEFFGRQETDETNVKLTTELMKNLRERVDEVAFFKKGKNVVTYGFLIPGCSGYSGGWAAIATCDWWEKNTDTHVPSLEDLRTNPEAQMRLINNEIQGSARSMRAIYAVSLAVVSRAKSRHDSESDNEEGGTDDDNDGPEKQPELQTENPELKLGFCKAVVSRIKKTPMLQRINSDAARIDPNCVIMTNYKRHMKLSHTNCDLYALVAMVAEGMEGTGDAGPLAHFTENDAAEKAATAELLIKDVTIDMSERTAELRKVTAFRMGALAVLKAAVDERLEVVNNPCGVKRAMAISVSSSKLAKRVKDELKGKSAREITTEFFSLKDNNKLLVAEREESDKQREAEQEEKNKEIGLLKDAVEKVKAQLGELKRQLQDGNSSSALLEFDDFLDESEDDTSTQSE